MWKRKTGQINAATVFLNMNLDRMFFIKGEVLLISEDIFTLALNQITDPSSFQPKAKKLKDSDLVLFFWRLDEIENMVLDYPIFNTIYLRIYFCFYV